VKLILAADQPQISQITQIVEELLSVKRNIPGAEIVAADQPQITAADFADYTD
jgi:hypothetical protein